MLNLVNSFACLVSARLEASPNEQGTGNLTLPALKRRVRLVR